jgi:tetratricopeptide (TPR) repeat protein
MEDDLVLAISRDPTIAEYRLERGRSRYETEHYDLAVEDLTLVTQLSTDLEDLKQAYNLLAISYQYVGEPQDLVACLDWLIEHGFGDTNKFDWRADYRARFGDLIGAVEDMTKALELSPQNTTTLLRRAQVYYRIKRYDEVLADLTPVIELNTEYRTILSVFYHWRAKTYYQLGRHDEALADFNEEMRLSYAAALLPDATAYMKTFAPEDLQNDAH